MTEKQSAELEFWAGEVAAYRRWFAGAGPLYGVHRPGSDSWISCPDPTSRAILNFSAANRNRYPKRLGVPADHFAGRHVLDVGCGPLGAVLGFTGCTIVGVDELLGEYRRLGYPLNLLDSRLTLLEAPAESIPFPDASFDAVISVNAIDHVADLRAAAAEIMRLLRPGGELLIECHYHGPLKTEPQVLDDATVLSAFSDLQLHRLGETPHWQGPLVVWSTHQH